MGESAMGCRDEHIVIVPRQPGGRQVGRGYLGIDAVEVTFVYESWLHFMDRRNFSGY
jgi:hypothetical protein